MSNNQPSGPLLSSLSKHELNGGFSRSLSAVDDKTHTPSISSINKQDFDATEKKECNIIQKGYWMVFLYLMYVTITLFLTLLYMIVKHPLDLILQFHQFQRKYILGKKKIVNEADNTTRIQPKKENLNLKKKVQYVDSPKRMRTKTKARAQRRVARRKSDTFILARTATMRRSSSMTGGVLCTIYEGYE